MNHSNKTKFQKWKALVSLFVSITLLFSNTMIAFADNHAESGSDRFTTTGTPSTGGSYMNFDCSK